MNCEYEFLNGLKLYETIVESKILQTTESQIKNLDKEKNKIVSNAMRPQSPRRYRSPPQYSSQYPPQYPPQYQSQYPSQYSSQYPSQYRPQYSSQYPSQYQPLANLNN